MIATFPVTMQKSDIVEEVDAEEGAGHGHEQLPWAARAGQERCGGEECHHQAGLRVAADQNQRGGERDGADGAPPSTGPAAGRSW